jgi:SAM-dependent methyltransferase
MGAQATGVDLSGEAVEAGRGLAKELGLDAAFICCDVYDTRKHTKELFDVVFTSFGTIGWLPDLDRWAEVIASSLKPGGRFVWTFDDDLQHIAYDYFKSEPIVEEIEGTYADRNAPIKTQTISWNHSLSEVFSALLKTGLRVEHFREYDFSPHNCFKGMREESPGHFKFAHLDHAIPMVYSMVLVKEPI